MIRRSCLLAALGLASLAPAAGAAEYVPGEVIVRYGPDARAASDDAAAAARSAVVRTRRGQTVAEKIGRLRRRHGVLSATPNYIAHASYIPEDGRLAGAPVELRRPVRRQRALRVGPRRRGGTHGRVGRARRGARHGRRL